MLRNIASATNMNTVKFLSSCLCTIVFIAISFYCNYYAIENANGIPNYCFKIALTNVLL